MTGKQSNQTNKSTDEIIAERKAITLKRKEKPGKKRERGKEGYRSLNAEPAEGDQYEERERERKKAKGGKGRLASVSRLMVSTWRGGGG